MPGDQRSYWSSPLPWIGLVAGVGAVVVGFLLLGGGTREAAAATVSVDNAAGFQTTEKLLLTVGLSNPDARMLEGTFQVELIGPDGKSLAKSQQEVSQTEKTASYRFELPATKLPPDQLTLHCTFGKQELKTPLSRILVVKAHETALASSQEFFAGSRAALRCEVHGVKSVAENIPLAGAEVKIQLRAKDGKVIPLLTDKTGADGVSQAEFKVPEVPAGQYTL